MDVDPFAGTNANGTLIDTEFCSVDGMGTLASGDSFEGTVEQIDDAGGITGEIIFYGPEMEDPDCQPEPEDPDDDHGCHWNGGGHHGHHGHHGGGHGNDHGGGHHGVDHHGDNHHHGGHHGRWRGHGHRRHGNGHGWGHRNHDHDDGGGEDPVCEPLQDVIVLHPDVLRCRVNGLTLGDLDGMATVNDVEGYLFSLSMQAFDDPVADYISLRLWAPNPDYVPGGAEPEWVLDREIIDELATGQIEIQLP